MVRLQYNGIFGIGGDVFWNKHIYNGPVDQTTNGTTATFRTGFTSYGTSPAAETLANASSVASLVLLLISWFRGG